MSRAGKTAPRKSPRRKAGRDARKEPERKWSYSYAPYFTQEGKEIAAFEIFDAEGDKVCDTNENHSRKRQEMAARMICEASCGFSD